MAGLFTDTVKLNLPDSDISYIPGFLGKEEADNFFDVLRKTVSWRQDTIKVFGKTYPQPRLTALYATNGKTYSYSNITMEPYPFSQELWDLQQRIKGHIPIEFTTCLLNLYRNGQDSNGWHADDEKELGPNPTIASVTLGQERYFHLKHKKEKHQRHRLLLEHGSLLIMQGQTQHYWLHQIPKTAKIIGERINLTFRTIV